MKDETSPPEKTKEKAKSPGRPKKPKEEMVDKPFHFVCPKEEMEVFKIAGKMVGAPSTAAFIRMAIVQYELLPNQIIPEELQPLGSDKTTKHFPLLLSSEDRVVIDRSGRRNHSLYIRTAALAAALSSPRRTFEFEKAIKALADSRQTSLPEGMNSPVQKMNESKKVAKSKKSVGDGAN